MRIIVLAGFTGTGKTALLARLAALGEPTIDLEALANHRGSVFGAMPGAQPTHDAFAARVEAAYSASRALFVWIEDSAPFIGSVGLPPVLQQAIETASCVLVTSSIERRCARLIADYGHTPLPALHAAVARASRRLGTDRTAAITTALASGRTSDAVRMLLEYYDAAYERRMTLLGRRILATIDADASDHTLADVVALHGTSPQQ